MKFRKKPVVIDAFKWMTDIAPEWWRATEGIQIDVGTGCALIPTLEGFHRAQPGDMIIRGVKGEIYPCKPDIFEMTYEPVNFLEDLPEDTRTGPFHTPGHSFPCPACQPAQAPEDSDDKI